MLRILKKKKKKIIFRRNIIKNIAKSKELTLNLKIPCNYGRNNVNGRWYGQNLHLWNEWYPVVSVSHLTTLHSIILIYSHSIKFFKSQNQVPAEFDTFLWKELLCDFFLMCELLCEACCDFLLYVLFTAMLNFSSALYLTGRINVILDCKNRGFELGVVLWF